MWTPEQYERFKDERAQPFWDLVALVEHRPRMRIVDLGCGTGELTRKLHEHLGAVEAVGIDSSETMLLKSGSFGGEMLRFQHGTIEAFVTDQPYDLIFSNAALQWVAGHESLFQKLTAFVSHDGQLAVQMPMNDDHPSHAIAAGVAKDFGIAPRHAPLLPPERYSSLLYELGYKRQHVRVQIYGHRLDSSADVIDWVRGTLLTDYERRLGERFPEFLELYTKRLLAALGEVRPYFYTYKRVLIWGTF
jgi:trans-aconitate 2-methyltransferase